MNNIPSPKQVNKALMDKNTMDTAEAARMGGFGATDVRRRGIQVYNTSQLIAMTGRDEQGRLINWTTEQPYFYLTIDQRNQIFKLSSIIQGIVTSRMNRISAIDFNIVPVKKIEDKIVEKLKDLKYIYNEFKTSTNPEHIILKARIYKELDKILRVDLIPNQPLLKPDLSNFDKILLLWRHSFERKIESSQEEIKTWLNEPSAGVSISQYKKKFVYNLMVHGANATYKQEKYPGGPVENFDILPGGTVYKLKEKYFSSVNGYIQIIPGFESQIFFEKEISYTEYISVSSQSQSMIPLEALINLVSEHLLFTARSASVADGTAPPEKMVIITNQSPFGNAEDPFNTVPIEEGEQKRVESKINEPIKNRVMTFSGNNVEVVDLSRDDKFDYHNARMKDIREECAMVYNMSSIEINLTGSDDTSGRNTSIIQQEIEQGKGIAPILEQFDNDLTYNIIPFRFGFGWACESIKSTNELSDRQLDLLKLQTGEYTQNELRETRNRPVFDDEKYNLPKGDSAEQQQPGTNELNPMYTRQLS